jgi:hypothetical protein
VVQTIGSRALSGRRIELIRAGDLLPCDWLWTLTCGEDVEAQAAAEAMGKADSAGADGRRARRLCLSRWYERRPKLLALPAPDFSYEVRPTRSAQRRPATAKAPSRFEDPVAVGCRDSAPKVRYGTGSGWKRSGFSFARDSKEMSVKVASRKGFLLGARTGSFPTPPQKTPTTVGVFVFCVQGGP